MTVSREWGSADPVLLPVNEPKSRETMTWIHAAGGPVIVVWRGRVRIGDEMVRCGGRWVAVPEWTDDRWTVRLYRVMRGERPVDLLRVKCRLWAKRQRAEVSA